MAAAGVSPAAFYFFRRRVTDRFQKLVWAGLIAALVGIVVVYAVTESRRAPLPVIARVRPFVLTNQLAQPVAHAALRGQVAVVNVVFSRCPIQCPKLMQQMGRIQAGVGPGVRLLTLTADPGFDTPAVLARYGQKFGVDPAKWWLLTGDKAELYRLATEDLKFNLLENAGPPPVPLADLFIHSTDFAVLDKAGRLRAVVHGEDAEAVATALALVKQLLRETDL